MISCVGRTLHKVFDPGHFVNIGSDMGSSLEEICCRCCGGMQVYGSLVPEMFRSCVGSGSKINHRKGGSDEELNKDASILTLGDRKSVV